MSRSQEAKQEAKQEARQEARQKEESDLEVRVEQLEHALAQSNEMVAALRENEQRFMTAIASSPVFVYTCDLEQRYTWIHKPYPGFDPSKLIGKRDEDFASHGEYDELIALKNEALVNGERIRREIPILVDGEPRYYDFTVEPVTDARGVMCGLNIAAYEVTERQQLRVSMAELDRVRHILEASTDSCWDWDIESDQMYWSDGVFAAMGLEPGAITPSLDALRELIHPDDSQRVLSASRAHLRDQEPFRLELRMRHVDGSYRWFLSRALALRDRSGKAYRMVGVSTDVTGMKESAIALQRMAKVFMESADAVLIMDREGLIVEINPAAERQYGWFREELLGESTQKLVPRTEQVHRSNLMAACLAGEEVHSVEATQIARDGRTLPTLLSLSQLTDDAGAVVGLVSLSKDISTMRNLQREVLEVADREQRRMGEDLHDSVQQDLAGFRMIARSLVDSLDAKGTAFIEANELVDFQTKLARFEVGLAQTSDTIAAMSRGLAGLQVESLGLPEALRNMVHDVRQTTDIDCHVDCSDSLRLDATATATHLFRITQEAVTNALKHSNASRIRITLRVHDDVIRVEIRDNGRGFEGTSDQGMGLSIMAHRASLLAGTFAVNRVKSGGTLVTCDIPVSHLA